jgi:hypothetical protein
VGELYPIRGRKQTKTKINKNSLRHWGILIEILI